jgi:hypothetical protein
MRRRLLLLLKRDAMLAALIVFAAAAIRLDTATRQVLDEDEMFSLAISTGHSLEQPPEKTRPELGDFVPAPLPQPASEYAKYTTHSATPAGPRRVVRAVFLSDTNPPLYYLLLNLWTRAGGTSDLNLRLFSVLLSVASIPLIFLLARRLLGQRAALYSAALFALAPQAVFHGTEGRMYALLIALTLLTGLLTVRLHRRPNWWAAFAWIVCSAAGVLTHYFFVFGWAAMCAWLLFFPHRMARWQILLLVCLVLGIVAPWFMLLPESMEGWRITRGWLELEPRNFHPVTAQVRLLAGYFLVAGDWMNREGKGDYVILALIGLTAIVGLRVLPTRVKMPGPLLLVLWLAAVMGGLLVFDLLQGTYARNHSRYAFVGMPAAIMLFGAVLARVPRRAGIVAFVALVAMWVPGLMRLNVQPRGDNPFRTIAQSVEKTGTENLIVIAHGIPSGVLGTARYLHPQTLMLDWITELGNRNASDLDRIVRTASRVTLFKLHSDKMSAEEEFLRPRSSSVTITDGVGFQQVHFVLDRARR